MSPLFFIDPAKLVRLIASDLTTLSDSDMGSSVILGSFLFGSVPYYTWDLKLI